MNACDRPSLLERFATGFLAERNIRWLLFAGLAILLGSSVMLVTSNWTQLTGPWQHLVCLGYSAAVWGIGHWCTDRAGLRRTGAALLLSSAILTPTGFLIWAKTSAVHLGTVAGAGLVLQLLLLWAVGRHVLRRFLRVECPRFEVAYGVLAIAGAVVPFSSFVPPPILALVLWGVFAWGATGASERLFCTVERHGRIVLGYVPLLLLGGQLVTLLGLYLLPSLTLEMLGLGVALSAAPVFAAADALRRAAPMRADAGLRSWSIGLPMTIAALFGLVGTTLAASGLASGGGHAVVPAAAVSAMMFAISARRFGRAWLLAPALLLATIAYNFSPLFFRELARSVVAGGAELVAERRLPFAFYGLTYVPLLLVASLARYWARSRGSHVFAKPLAVYSFAVSTVLLGVSWMHAKAVFPVGLALAIVQACDARLHRSAGHALLASLALLSATCGMPGFVENVLDLRLGWTRTTCVSVVALGMSAAGAWMSRRRSVPGLFFVLPALVTISVWMIENVILGPIDATATAVATAVFGVLAWQRSSTISAGLTLAIPGFAWITRMSASGIPTVDLLGRTTLAVAATWMASHMLTRAGSRIRVTFGQPYRDIARLGLVVAVSVWHLPLTLIEVLGSDSPASPAWLGTRTLLVSCCVSSWHTAPSGWTRRILAWVSIPALLALVTTAVLAVLPLSYLPVVWSCAITGAIVFFRLTRRATPRQLSVVARTVLVAIVGWSFVWFALPLQFAAAVSFVGLYCEAGNDRWRAFRNALASWRSVSLPMLWCGHGSFLELRDHELWTVLPAVGLVAACVAGLWSRRAGRLQSGRHRDFAELQAALLSVASMLAMFASAGRTLPAGSLCIAALGFAVWITLLMLRGVREQSEGAVWGAIWTLAASVAFFRLHGVFHFDGDFVAFLPLAIALAAAATVQLTSRASRASVLIGPLSKLGLYVPLAVFPLCVWRQVTAREASLGIDSLPLLIAAAIWFHAGVTRGKARWFLLAAIACNVSLALLWHDLSWSDPQLFSIPIGASILLLTERLGDRLPARARNPLRYAGALVILVSPTFHAVSGSWLHMGTLLLVSLVVLAAGIGMQVRALVYTGAAFLVADLVAMVVRGAIDEPDLLWIFGVLLGGTVLWVAALCESRRERLLQRARIVAARLGSWD